MKFDEKYPMGNEHINDYKNTVKSQNLGICGVCKNQTHWINLDFECYICSEECLNQLWEEYTQAERKL